MSTDTSDGPTDLLRALAPRGIGRAIMMLFFLGFWGLLFGSAVRTHLARGNIYMAAFAGAWLVSPVVPLGWMVARNAGRGQRLFRWLSVGTYAALLAVYWAYLWGHSLVDQFGTLSTTLFQGTLLVSPLLVAAAIYVLMWGSQPDVLPTSSSG